MLAARRSLPSLLVALSLAGCGGTSLTVDGGGAASGGSTGSGSGTGGRVGGSGGATGSGGVTGSGGSASGGAPGSDGGSDARVCPALGCAPMCPYGVFVDTNGCPTCKCNPTPPVCPKIACAKDCPNGFENDAQGCPTCQCKPGLMCGPVCDIFCEFGNVTDANGCPLCKCNPPPTPTSCDRSTCPSPAPGAPNYLCPDGKTVAGPACVPQANGACGWSFISCPPKCVQNVLCIIGSHWDPDLCKCVPPACACAAGEVCVQQIGGPAIKDPPPVTCEAPDPMCAQTKTTVCACLSKTDGRCQPNTDGSLCICDNGIR